MRPDRPPKLRSRGVPLIHFLIHMRYAGMRICRSNLRWDFVQAMGVQESPVLSMAPGFYREKPVLPVLRQHFLAVWFHRKPLGVAGHSAVVPDACAELVWCRSRLLIAGPDRQVSLEPVPPGTTAIGLRFLPGAVATLLRVPASEIVGARLPLDFFWSGKARELIGAIGDAQEPHVVAKRLEMALAQIARDFDSPDQSSKIILRCVARSRAARRPVMPELVSALGLSERTLRRHCEHAFGYGPKTLDRVLRMQRFLELSRTRPALGLANLAGAAGYADQAHLNREARRLTGLTPSAILEQLSESKKPRDGMP
jgi:AraC-like DNA-binding protein